MEKNIEVVCNSVDQYLLVLGDRGVLLSRKEAEQLFVDLGRTLRENDET